MKFTISDEQVREMYILILAYNYMYPESTLSKRTDTLINQIEGAK